MADYFKVYESLVKHNYINNLFEIGVAHNSQIGENSPHLYIKHLFDENERLNSQTLYNSQEKTEFLSIITQLNVEILALKGEISKLTSEIKIDKSSDEVADIDELIAQNEILTAENQELIEYRIRLQKSNAYWINTIFRLMMKTSLRQKYSSEILQMQDVVINNFKDTPKVVDRTKAIINEFFKK